MSRIIVILFAVLIIAGFGAYFFLPEPSEKRSDATEPGQASVSVEKDSADPAKTSPPSEKPLPVFSQFGTVSVIPDSVLDGAGTNIDSPEFWEAPDPKDTLLLVSAKGNDLIEIWKYPFTGNELPPLALTPTPNGLDVDQDRDLLLVGDSRKRAVLIYSLPSRTFVRTIGEGQIRSGETNIDILDRNGGKWVFVSESHAVRAFDLDTGALLTSFEPRVESIEEVLADNFSQTIYIPEEEGVASDVIQGGGITAYAPDGSPMPSDGENIFGNTGVFSGDAEGVALYTCASDGVRDNGAGLIIVADQAGADTGLIFFDRTTWKYLGTLRIRGVTGTDGIASTQLPFPLYPLGLLAVTDRDSKVALVSWEKILSATKLSCDE